MFSESEQKRYIFEGQLGVLLSVALIENESVALYGPCISYYKLLYQQYALSQAYLPL